MRPMYVIMFSNFFMDIYLSLSVRGWFVVKSSTFNAESMPITMCPSLFIHLFMNAVHFYFKGSTLTDINRSFHNTCESSFRDFAFCFCFAWLYGEFWRFGE